MLTFDYQLQFGDNGEFADAVAALLRHLKEKVWLVGQSLGGVVAQVIASRHRKWWRGWSSPTPARCPAT